MNNKIAIVTGAGSIRGIGCAIARSLASLGNHVIICDINIDSAKQISKQINDDGFSSSALQLDVTKQQQVNQAIQNILDEFGGINILINNAGVAKPSRILEITDEEFDFIFNVNVKGTFYLTQAVLPSMIERKFGRIVNLGSVAAKRGGGIFGGSHYSAVKGAIMSFTKAVAREVAEHGITVNSVAPGLIGTGITGNLLDDSMKVEKLIGDIPVGRIGTVEEVANAVAFLASEGASYITGEEIDINGGSHID